jgi:hypothetical protein
MTLIADIVILKWRNMTNTQCTCRCHWGYKDYPDKLADSIKQCEHCSPNPDAIGTDTVREEIEKVLLQLYNIAYNDSALSRAAILKRPKRNFAEYSNQIQSLLTKEKTQLLDGELSEIGNKLERIETYEERWLMHIAITHHSVNPITVSSIETNSEQNNVKY